MDSAEFPLVLVIDDEQIVREVADAILTRAGFRVLLAGSSLEGLELFARHASEIAAVLLDRTLPVLDGEGVLGELRRLREDVPVVFCSGYGQDEATTEQVPGPEPRFLHKPFRTEALVEAVRGALGGG